MPHVVRRNLGLAAGYLTLPLVTLVILHLGLLPGGYPTFYALYAALAVYTVVLVAIHVRRGQAAELGITRRRLPAALLLGLSLSVLTLTLFPQLRAFQPAGTEGVGRYVAPALLAALAETVAIYGWLDRELRRRLSFWASATGTSALYALYHIGFYGFGERELTFFSLSLPLYFTSGLLSVLLVRAVGNLAVLWPFYVTVGSIYDLARQDLFVPGNTAPVLVGLLGLTLAALSAVLLLARRRQSAAQPAVTPEDSVRLPAWSDVAIATAAFRVRSQRPAVVLLGLLAFGLVIRYTINDPVGVQLMPYLPNDLGSRFLTERPFPNELIVRLAQGVFFIAPLTVLALARHLPEVSGGGRDSARRSSATAALMLTCGTVVATATAVAAVFVLLASLVEGSTVTASHVGRLALVVAAAAVYAVFNAAIFSVLAWVARGTRWYWMASLGFYQLIFFWYAVYPLFSQFAAVPHPNDLSGAEYGEFLKKVNDRSQILYAAVTYYDFYFVPAVGYLKQALDPVYFLPAIARHLQVAVAVSLGALLFAQNAKAAFPHPVRNVEGDQESVPVPAPRVVIQEAQVPDPAIEVVEVRRAYGDVVALAGVSISLPQGQVLGLLGPNGAGKTTLIECLEGLRRPSSGRVSVLGCDPVRDRRWLLPQIGVQLQDTALPDRIRVREAVALFASLYPGGHDVDGVLEQVGLAQVAARPFAKLSGGQKQRLSIALAIVHRPRMLFLDEVSTGLDAHARHGLVSLLEDIKSEGTTIVMATHYLEEAERLCDVVAVMDGGSLLTMAQPQQLVRDSGATHKVSVSVVGHVDERPLHALPRVTNVRRDGRTLTVAGVGRELFDQVVDELTSQGVPHTHGQVREFTLEDAFLDLVPAFHQDLSGVS